MQPDAIMSLEIHTNCKMLDLLRFHRVWRLSEWKIRKIKCTATNQQCLNAATECCLVKSESEWNVFCSFSFSFKALALHEAFHCNCSLNFVHACYSLRIPSHYEILEVLTTWPVTITPSPFWRHRVNIMNEWMQIGWIDTKAMCTTRVWCLAVSQRFNRRHSHSSN